MPQTFTFRTIVRSVVIGLGILLLVFYILWQARFLIAGPQISLSEEPNFLNNSRLVTLSGSTRNITRITLNGRQMYTNPDGYFSEDLVLENGYTIATIAATDRYGRTTKLERSFMYTPASVVNNI